MVSVDHYKQELGVQLTRATRRGAMDVLITAGELYRTLGRADGATDACCQAMQEEIKPGDVVLIERIAGIGMTVRYLLPRPGR
jgi:UDP-N-acetylmuramyl pentapeptide synthase